MLYKAILQWILRLACLRVGPVLENVPSEKRRGYCTARTHHITCHYNTTSSSKLQQLRAVLICIY